jgi:hypothetical protein
MQTGRLVPVDDVAHLRQALVWCAQHPQERAQLAMRGRAMCESAFSTRAMIDGLECVYTRALALRDAGR